MTYDQLEFAISQYLDGTLPPEEKAALERELVVNPQAARLLEQHIALDKAVKSIHDLPPVKWDLFSRQISQAVASQALGGTADVGEVPDELEFAIMQYVDGELAADEREALEKRLADDPAARRILAQHRALDVVLKHGWPMPHVDYDRFAEHLGQTVGEQVAPSSYRITNWMRRTVAVAVALAACLLIAIGLGVYFATRDGGQANRPIAVVPHPRTGAPKPVVVVNVLPPDSSPSGNRIEIVSIGAPDDGPSYDVGELVAGAKPHIEIENEMFTIYSDFLSTP